MKTTTLTVMFVVVAAANILAQEHVDLRKKNFNLEKRSVAIQGYDPVAYFKQNKAAKGSAEMATNFDGITYYFSSEENKKAFKKDPARYEPEYGGWCAYAMGAKASKVEIDPETFKVLNGKLYLFYNKYLNNTLKAWEKDELNLKIKADANWQKLYH